MRKFNAGGSLYTAFFDAKVHAFSREIRDDPCRESSWTPFQQNLGRRLFKGGATSDVVREEAPEL